MNCRKFLPLVGFLAISLFASKGYASAISWYDIDTLGAESTPLPDSTVPCQNQVEQPQVSLNPALDLWGLLGRYATAKGQFLWPFGGNTQTSVFYGMLEGSIATKNTGWMIGTGAGYRKTFDSTYVLGGYLLADFNQTTHNHTFAIANPGLEVLGGTWDVRVNGYYPMTSRKNNFNQGQWMEEVSPGIDGEVGSVIPGLCGLKAYVGGYYFAMSDTAKITGYAARLEFPIKKIFILTGRFYHDNVQGSTLLGGLKIALGGVPEAYDASAGVNGRLMDAIEHDLGAFGHGAGVPINTAPLNP